MKCLHTVCKPSELIIHARSLWVVSAVLYVYVYMASWDLEDDSTHIVYFTHMDYFITLLFVLLWDKTVLTVPVAFAFPYCRVCTRCLKYLAFWNLSTGKPLETDMFKKRYLKGAWIIERHYMKPSLTIGTASGPGPQERLLG